MSDTLTLKPYAEDGGNFNDISGLEEWREYVWPDGSTYRIDNPIKVQVKRKPEGDSHRLVDAQGIRHYVPSGWLTFKFKGKWGVN